MRLKIIVAGFAIGILLTSSAAAQLPGDGVPVIASMLEHREELGLSVPQVEALRRLGADFIRETIRRQADLMVTDVDLGDLFGDDPGKAIDLARAETKLREMQRIQTDLRLALLRVIEAGKAQLTPDQRAKLAMVVGVGAQDPADPPSPANANVTPVALPLPARTPGHPAPGHPAPGHPAPSPRPGFEHHRPSVHGHVFIDVWPPLWWGPYWWAYPAPPAPPVIVQQPPPVYTEPPAPTYWYYCPSARAYYPYVSSCPEPWVPVPATPQ